MLVKPKHTVYKVINKFLIMCDIKLPDKTPVYFSWKKKQPKWVIQEGIEPYPETFYLTVDYNKKTREWDVGYIQSVSDRKFATIDDITGTCTIHNNLKPT
jgi:hypothetical protein